MKIKIGVILLIVSSLFLAQTITNADANANIKMDENMSGAGILLIIAKEIAHQKNQAAASIIPTPTPKLKLTKTLNYHPTTSTPKKVN